MWIHVPPPPPSTSSPSVPDRVTSIWVFGALYRKLARSVTWREKLMPSKHWLKVSSRIAWMRHLSGQIYTPTTANHGVESWIASLAAIRANRSAQPVRDAAKTIQDTFGPRSLALLAKLNPASCSLKTYQGMSPSDSPKSSVTYKNWAMRLRRDCLARKKRVQTTNGIVFSSSACRPPRWSNSEETNSQNWITPHGMSGIDKDGKRGAGGEFAKQASQWMSQQQLQPPTQMWPTATPPTGGRAS